MNNIVNRMNFLLKYIIIYSKKHGLHIALMLQMLYGCSAQNQYSPQENQAIKLQDSAPAKQDLHMSRGTEAQHKWKQCNCPRGVPAPTLNFQNPNIVGKNFVLMPEAGIENAKLFNGDSLQIENTGCDFYELIYTLKSFNIASNIQQDASYWFERSADLLLALQDSDIPFDPRVASENLKKLSLSKKTKLLQEYTLQTNGTVTQKVVLEHIGNFNGNKGGYMRLKIFIGPL
ncbi:MAG: hypothetical protein EOP53_10870 [Sphingobacteriales bacterium]|nr:MAG: hypothetical protein EOP53_10870 [Sphingobacteriales bacterium]